MCVFSGSAKATGTKIFAAAGGDGRQVLVYSMSYQSREDLAMILPIPVPSGAGEDSVRFINLQSYRTFFGDLSHPMAFDFPTSRSDHLFFPLVQVHDLRFHTKARFDHALYCQSRRPSIPRWEASAETAAAFMRAVAAEIVQFDQPCHRSLMSGKHKNEDGWLLNAI